MKKKKIFLLILLVLGIVGLLVFLTNPKSIIKMNKKERLDTTTMTTPNGTIILRDSRTGNPLSGGDLTLTCNGEEIELNNDQGYGHFLEDFFYQGDKCSIKTNSAPKGYLKGDDSNRTFEIKGDSSSTWVESTLKTEIDEQDNLVIYVDYKPTVVGFTTIDSDYDFMVEGVQFIIVDEAVDRYEALDEWTSGMEYHKTIHLDVNKRYTLYCTVPADGYILDSTGVDFIINEDGSITTENSTFEDEVGDTIIIINEFQTKVRIAKTDIANGEELSGARLQILDENNTVVRDFTTTVEAEEVRGLLTNHLYTIKEIVPPEGYTLTSPITFSIDEYGNVTTSGQMADYQEILVEDSITKIKASVINKDTYEPILGQEMQILDENNEPVRIREGNNYIYSWYSEEEPKLIEGLSINKQYKLHETITLDGYEPTEDIIFTIKADGRIETEGSYSTDENGIDILLFKKIPIREDDVDYSTVSIKKVDENNELLSGASLELRDKNGNIIDSWISTNSIHEIPEQLLVGERYTLFENNPPAGYITSEPLEFEVANQETQTITLRNVKESSTKKIIVKIKLIDEDNNLLPDGTLQLVDNNGNVIEEWKTTKDLYEITAELEPNKEYTIIEKDAPNGYIKSDNIKINIRDTEEVQIFEVINKKTNIPSIIVNPKTSPIIGIPLLIIIFSIVGVFALKQKKRYNI